MRRDLSLMLGSALVLSIAACGGDSKEEPGGGRASPELAAKGEVLFRKTCIACHGPAGEGMPNLGKDMTRSEFIKSKTDEELLAFIKVGRRPGDPLNTTGVDMPPKGGFPALDEDDLKAIVAYIRTLMK